jgi:putative SOS response-associated peptidase YedK
VPYWAEDVAIGNRLINARADAVERTPAFREAYRRRRCLVPADGFFEWRKDGKRRQPLLVRRKDGAPFAFAGLWERWKQPDGQVLRSCTIITCPPNDLVAPVHDRMPVLLDPADLERWLDPEAANGRELLKPCPAEWLEAVPVSPRVNSPDNDDRACITPLVEPEREQAQARLLWIPSSNADGHVLDLGRTRSGTTPYRARRASSLPRRSTRPVLGQGRPRLNPCDFRWPETSWYLSPAQD